jgi:hypothetical protein
MNLDALFATYYTLYRVEAQIPNSQDDEYIIFTALSTEAISRWANYDNTFWKELFDTNQADGSGDTQLAVGQTEYQAPSNFRAAGGYLRVFDSTGTTQRRIKIIEPQDVQFQADTASYCWFRGDPNNGFTLVLNPEPDAMLDGMNFDYTYYKAPDLLAAGSDLPQMSQPMFIVHRCLANRFRGSRNPFYTSAKGDAEDILKTMQMENNSGNWADPWALADHTGGRFGVGTSPGGFFD